MSGKQISADRKAEEQEKKAEKKREKQEAEKELKKQQRLERKAREEEEKAKKAAEDAGEPTGEDPGEGNGEDGEPKNKRRRRMCKADDVSERDPVILKELRSSSGDQQACIYGDFETFVTEITRRPSTPAVIRLKKGPVKKVLQVPLPQVQEFILINQSLILLALAFCYTLFF